MTPQNPMAPHRTTRCAVLGSPIEHSLSPVLHRAGYAALGLDDWEYQRHQVDESQLPGFVAGLDDSWRGLSLTMPLKRAALALGEPDPLCLLADAANTLIVDRSGRSPVLRLYNTDVDGLVDAFAAVTVTSIDTATILGSGATARSAMISVARMGAHRVQIVARRVAHARQSLAETARALEIELVVSGWPGQPDPSETGRDAPAQTANSSTGAIPAADVVVSTAVAGAADPIAADVSRAAPVIFDVIYDPWPTELARVAGGAGCTVINGVDLLVHQAVGQLELMTGRRVDARVLLDAGRDELARRRT